MGSLAAVCLAVSAVGAALTVWIVPATAQSTDQDIIPRGTTSRAASFGGLWAKTTKECLDEDGPNSRTLIDLTNVVDGKPTPIFDQYENHCLIDWKSTAGEKTSLNVTCFEFWDNFTKRVDGEKRMIKLSPGGNNRLVINGESYVRCEANRAGIEIHQGTAPVPSTPHPFDVTFNVPSSFEGSTIQGRTNLPDGTEFIVTLMDPPGCQPHCGAAQAKSTVKAGQFHAGPFRIDPGNYTLEITMDVAGGEPAEVQAVIGAHGENLRGPYVKPAPLGLGPMISYVAQVWMGAKNSMSLGGAKATTNRTNAALKNPDMDGPVVAICRSPIWPTSASIGLSDRKSMRC
jgi:hypothetical protein